MKRDKEHFRHLLLYCFDSKKTAAETHRFVSETYSESAPSAKTCEHWYRPFKSGDFYLEDKECSGQPKKFEDAELKALLDENSTRTLEELAEALNVGKSTVSDYLYERKGSSKLGSESPDLSRIANAVWNNLLEPVGNKATNSDNLFERFLCPTPENPYLVTMLNSRK